MALTLGGRPHAVAAAPGRALPSPTTPSSSRPGRALRILVLGGTSFIGPHQVQYALDRGHEITLFNRGRTNTDLFPGVERLVGDRNGDLESLRGRTWDVCIDNSASNIRWVEFSTAALRDSVDRYFYVSSRSAYADTSAVPMTADHPTFTYETAGVDRDADRNTLPYGLQKALCERQTRMVFGDRACIFRPGLIIGPRDRTDRFTYWPVRIHRGGEVLSPGNGSDPIQIIDARDFGEWMIRMAEDGHTGVYNAVGPAVPRPMDELLYGIRAVTTAETTFTWVDTQFLLDRDVRPYREMPVWMPPLPGREGYARFDLTPEVERGLTFRPLAVTAQDTLEYHFARPQEEQWPLRAGITPEREAQVLAEWHRSRGGRG
ncbi:MAG: NAD-dependent epimerase/dehydratase family protein [Gemmatimonadales bacterium]|nr:MAG: NAD-dependent epimerase/dehydratase family protein [Gemmatimonadales bacterium]